MSMNSSKSFDLANVFARKAEKLVPQIVGVITMKGEGHAEATAAIAAAGFKVDEFIEMEDGSVVFKQIEKAEGDGIVVRLDDRTAVITKGFRPYNMDMTVGETSFSDMAAAQGFYPSVSTVLDVVRGSIYAVVEKAESPDTAAVAVAKMFDEAKTYATTMIRGLPAMAFKLESSEPVEVEPEGTPVAETDPVAVVKAAGKMTAAQKVALKAQIDALEVAEPTEEEKALAVKAEAEAAAATAAAAEGKDGVKKSDETAPQALTAEDVSRIVVEQTGKGLGDFAQKMELLMSGLSESVKKSFAEVNGTVAKLGEQVAKAEAKATAVAETVSGMTVEGAGGGDHVVISQRALKNETGMGGREIDTAYMPRNARQRRQ